MGLLILAKSKGEAASLRWEDQYLSLETFHVACPDLTAFTVIGATVKHGHITNSNISRMFILFYLGFYVSYILGIFLFFMQKQIANTFVIEQ